MNKSPVIAHFKGFNNQWPNLTWGVAHVQCMCALMMKPQIRPGFLDCSRALLMWHEWEQARPLSAWLLTFYHAPSNGLVEALPRSGTVWLEERLSVCEILLIVWRWTCSTHTGSGGMSLTSLCAFWCCAVVLALFVDFQWSVKISWGMGGTGWCCCGCVLSLPSGPASGPLSILNAH